MEKIQDIVIKAIMPDLNDNGMQISEDTVTNIIIDCKVKEPFATALRHTVDWFNGQQVDSKLHDDQKRYVGSFINIMTLLAQGDVVTLVDNWVLSGMNNDEYEDED